MNFPLQIIIKAIESKSQKTVPDLIFQMTLFAEHKNNYSFILPKTDQKGEVVVTKEWIEKEIEKERNLFVMDYSSKLDECKKHIEIKLLNHDEIQKSIIGLNTYKNVLKIKEEYITSLNINSNSLFKSITKNIIPENDNSCIFELQFV